MATLQELFQKAVDTPYEQRVLLAKESLGKCYAHLNAINGGDKDTSADALTLFLAGIISVDGKYSAKEAQMVSAIFGKDIIADVLDILTPEIFEDMDKLVDSLPEDTKLEFCTLALSILAVDGELTVDEQSYLYKLLD